MVVTNTGRRVADCVVLAFATATATETSGAGVFGQTSTSGRPVTAPMQTSMAEADAAKVRRSVLVNIAQFCERGSV